MVDSSRDDISRIKGHRISNAAVVVEGWVLFGGAVARRGGPLGPRGLMLTLHGDTISGQTVEHQVLLEPSNAAELARDIGGMAQEMSDDA